MPPLPKKHKLDYPDSKTNVGILPREILCIIFAYLEEKSIQSASETCKLWLEIIRNDSNWSSYIFLKYNGLKELQAKIERSDWIWDRWPVLKVIELGPQSVDIKEPQSVKEAVDLVKSINFKECPTLEKVIFSVNIDWEDFIPECPELKIATVEQLTYNPQHVYESFGAEQISVLHINADSSSLYRSIDVSELMRFNQNISGYLNDSIQTVKLTLKYHSMIHYLQNVCDFVTDLYVKDLPGKVLKRCMDLCPAAVNGSCDFEIIQIFQQFKRMRKCQVNVPVCSSREWRYFEMHGPIIVNEKFQDMTEVTFVFKNCIPPTKQGSEQIFEAFKVTKKQFEKSDILEKNYLRKRLRQ